MSPLLTSGAMEGWNSTADVPFWKVLPSLIPAKMPALAPISECPGPNAMGT
eukprot:CAMPEP_0184464360 /NCGR_PEP_ID=MMETSP0740-20130409/56679_1 /TAXON_ID=385413 /ORGANISM="Thalassiosira miniscula, Strain CCMP1093" /LENGTH=50 /DNA_ID=CAMNT_0026838849 /DNA_START=81 /DNA_END=229 /DNA_ORIENTATION=+